MTKQIDVENLLSQWWQEGRVFLHPEKRMVVVGADARALAYVVRHLRMGRVRVTGRTGRRSIRIRPRNLNEWPKTKAPVKGNISR